MFFELGESVIIGNNWNAHINYNIGLMTLLSSYALPSNV